MKPPLSVHFIDCGQGNMALLVTPQAVIVYDCRLTEDNSNEIIAYLRNHIPVRTVGGEKKPWIDWFICSHRDQDHIHGLQKLHESFPVRGIVDPGTTSGSCEGDENLYYMGLRRTLRAKYGDNAVLEPKPSVNPYFNFDGVRFYCLCSGTGDEADDDGHYGNNVFQVEYAGNRILLTGDSDWRAWKEKIVPTFRHTGLLATTVLVASHHGSRTFFIPSTPDVDEDDAWEVAYDEHLALIAPSSVVISCGSQEIHNHPNETALQRYKDATKEHQVHLTRERGTLIGSFKADGQWSITPARFFRGWSYNNYCPPGKSMSVTCRAYRDNRFVREVRHNDQVEIGHELRFEITTSGGLADNIAKASYTFEVSNGGIGRDASHDEIYYKKRSENGAPNTFTRDLTYVGTHLLRCRVRNGGHSAQAVFAVHGIAGA